MHKDSLNKINRLYLKWHYILIYTLRFMGRSNEKVSKANKIGYQFDK